MFCEESYNASFRHGERESNRQRRLSVLIIDSILMARISFDVDGIAMILDFESPHPVYVEFSFGRLPPLPLEEGRVRALHDLIFRKGMFHRWQLRHRKKGGRGVGKPKRGRLYGLPRFFMTNDT